MEMQTNAQKLRVVERETGTDGETYNKKDFELDGGRRPNNERREQ